MQDPNEPLHIHMVGNAHIDPAWLWTYAEGRAEVLATYRAAVELLRADPDVIFTAGGSSTYEWVEQDDPDLLAAIREMVGAGRWCLVNGWWVQPDCNIPSAESFARHALYGQRTLERLFGRRATVGYNVDSFGHHGALPGLLGGAGLTAYIFARPGAHEKPDLPADYFWWEGIDGTRMLAARLTAHYASSTDRLAARIERAAAGAHPAAPHVLCFFGVGNHGGGPTRADLAVIRRAQAASEGRVVALSSPDRFFEAIRPAASALPAYRGELQHHARGCYTAVPELKRLNRRAENALTTAEAACVWASTAAGADYPDLSAAWKAVLLHQFHDTMGGTCIPEVYEDDVFPALRGVIGQAEAATRAALAAIGARVMAEGEGQRLLVYNPLSFARKDVVHAAVPTSHWDSDFAGDFRPDRVTVTDPEGREVAAQVTALEHYGGTYRLHFAFVAALPPLGYRIFTVRIPDDAGTYSPQETPLREPLENPWLRVALDLQAGWISQLVFKPAGANPLAGPGGVPLVVDDPSDTWSHSVSAFDAVIGRFEAGGDVALLEDGPVRQVARVRARWGDSTLTLRLALYRELARVDCAYTIDWHEQHKMLKLEYALAGVGAETHAEIPGGALRRQADGEEQPCARWVDVGGAAGGLSVLNDSVYAYDARPGALRMSLLRSPIYAFHEPRKVAPGVQYRYTAQGRHTFRLALTPRQGELSCAAATRDALALNAPPVVVPIPLYTTVAQPLQPTGSSTAPAPPQTLPPTASWAEAAAPVVIEALKLAEDSSGDVIVRARETDGAPCRATLRVGAQTWEAAFSPFQARTWRLWRASAAAPPVEVNLLEEPLDQ